MFNHISVNGDPSDVLVGMLQYVRKMSEQDTPVPYGAGSIAALPD